MKARGVEDQFNYEDMDIDRRKVYQQIMAKNGDQEEKKKKVQKFEEFVSSMNLDEIIESKKKSMPTKVLEKSIIQ